MQLRNAIKYTTDGLLSMSSATVPESNGRKRCSLLV